LQGLQDHLSEMMAEADDVLAAELAECSEHLRNVRMANAHRVAAQRKRVRALDDGAEDAPASEVDEAAQELLALRDAEPQVESEGARLGRIVQQAIDGQTADRRVIVLRRAVLFPPDFEEQLARVVGNRVTYSIQDEYARCQANLELGRIRRSRHLLKLAEVLNHLIDLLAVIMPGRVPADWTALWSNPGCATQHPHFDYHRDSPMPENWRERAFSMILATSDGALLPVWNDKEHMEQVEVFRLDKGDLIFFRSDVLHAGAPYEGGHRYRIHAYMDSQAVAHEHGKVDRLDELTEEQLAKIDEDVKRACASL
jgi:hypothetical protein